ncbi:MAG: DUF1552 domain-containing protein [Deltaproteobacteria bacterium]|nr:DUF1552 domain-containing protein [Nannocystaceae bacterium]
MRRRRFIHALGGGLAALPVLGGLGGRSRAGGSSPAAQRLLVFFSPNGTVHEHWRPQGGETDFSFASGSVLEPLADLRERLIVCDGLDFVAATNHEGGMAAMLTGQGDASSVTGGKSIDQYVAARLASPTKFSSLELGVLTSPWGGGIQTRMSYSAPGTFVTPDDDPHHVFDRMFADLVGGDEAAARLRARRQRVVDLLVDDVSSLRGRLGAAERVKMDAHLEALAQLEQGLTAVSCDPAEAPLVGDHLANDSFPAVGQSMMNLLTMALMCDMTRVATIQWSHTVSPVVFSWLGVGEQHHSLSHIDDSNTAGVAQFVQCERWFAERFAELLTQLDALPDPSGEGTMLDTTLVVWAKELGDSRLHECRSVPFVLAGASQQLTPGRYLDFGGTAHNHLLVSICQAMGLDNDSFGDASLGTGPLEGLA